MTGIESLLPKKIENDDLTNWKDDLPTIDKLPNIEDERPIIDELPGDIENGKKRVVEVPDVSFIERTSRSALIEKASLRASEKTSTEDVRQSEVDETKSEGLTEEEKTKIKEETGWSDEIIEHIKNMKQYEILKNAGLIEVEINGRKCLIKENIDLDYTDEDGVSNRERIARGLAPLDSKTGKPLELHHLGQKADSPLVELTEEEHRTGEYEDGKKNQSLWHDNTVQTEVHGEGNNWDQERKAHWKARAEQSKE